MPALLNVAIREANPPQDLIRTNQPHGSALNSRLVASMGAATHFARNDVIFDRDDTADRFFKVIDGTVRLCRHLACGRRHIVEFAMPGDLIGLADGLRQPLAAEAVTDAIVIGFSRANLERHAGAEPSVQADLRALMSTKLHNAQQQLCQLGHTTARQRMASLLLRMAARLDVAPGAMFALPMGRLDIADHLGLTVETVCRALTRLKSDGLVRMPSAHQFVLSDVAALCALAGND